MIYLDHAATTPLHPEALHAMEPFLTARYGNPSSLHTLPVVACWEPNRVWGPVAIEQRRIREAH